ncbi:heavy metal translocating P-type ATPase [Oceaniglobus trochenteri]|uniref:heavy metal translocating P-type ATPase n=1 Tax=Oceaniglobus trochenteri TaxID=2763260 RepID=UPI001CFF5F6E|nr:heavy metal translocating P-type ATPase [Oceaniglobus trochenteri]
MATIEGALDKVPQVASSRVNLTLRRIEVQPADSSFDLDSLLALLAKIGHPATVIDATDMQDAGKDLVGQALLRGVAIAGFGAMNVMLMSVSVWAGADGAMRDILHVLSGMIAVPIILYSGRFFFVSAWGALRQGRMNMDVPIALALLLALVLSVFETLRGGAEVFFDAALTLTFFLLIGRYLDHRMRCKARNAMAGLAKLTVKDALELRPDGTTHKVASADIRPDMVLRIPPGERMPVDARILRGSTDLDRALVTGESLPVSAGPDDEIEAGALNITGPVDVLALRPVSESFVADMTRMLATAEEGRGRYVRIADRVARFYAPVIHILAAATFLGWVFASGDWQTSAFVAISVLIVTCPCALALAVPVAHVVAAGRLMRDGILMKDGSALERLAQVDHIAFDKTGTLSEGTEMAGGGANLPGALAALAAGSTHPAARAIAAGLPWSGTLVTDTAERPGFGVEGRLEDGRLVRLGRAAWVAEIALAPRDGDGPAFAFEGGDMLRIPLSETLRQGAEQAMDSLRDKGLICEIISGDGERPVAAMARQLGDLACHHGLTPAGKVAHLQALDDAGHRVLMVGDGLNDTPALAAAHVSMSPASATDAGRAAADFVFLRPGLAAVPTALEVARQTARIVRQNFGLAVVYNCIAIPLAVAGYVTPLIAAIAMSSSSILVVANSLRLNRAAGTGTPEAPSKSVKEAPA